MHIHNSINYTPRHRGEQILDDLRFRFVSTDNSCLHLINLAQRGEAIQWRKRRYGVPGPYPEGRNCTECCIGEIRSSITLYRLAYEVRVDDGCMGSKRCNIDYRYRLRIYSKNRGKPWKPLIALASRRTLRMLTDFLRAVRRSDAPTLKAVLTISLKCS
jgi:hypothetical protein